MTTHVHVLEGCAPTPLAHYLKALAVLRLVSEQRDPTARGWWKAEAFWLATKLSREEIVRFFLEEYAPTPILSPWNGGSGFYYENDVGIGPIEGSSAQRFAPFRLALAQARDASGPLASAIAGVKVAEQAAKAAGRKGAVAGAVVKDAKAEKERVKDALLAACRRRWTGGLLEWFDSALALGSDGAASWPALLGSGGNDGRLDFTNNSMQHLATLFDCANPDGAPTAMALPLLRACLFAGASPGLMNKAVGQFLPGSAGGPNMGSGFEGDSFVNPWDFVLVLEGAVALPSSIVRSGDAADLPQAAAPFAVRSSGSGYGSAAGADEGPRGEQWMPLWPHPALHVEVQALFSEGRTRTRKGTSARAQDAARALARLGAARGVSQFERYGYIERNGQANLAVPLGRWQVAAQPYEELLDDIDSWMRRLRAFARDDGAPRAIASAARVIDEAILAVCRSGGDPLRWQALLIALGRAEAAILRSPRKAGDAKAGLSPLPPLRPRWIAAATDGSVEMRLAVALASQDVALRHRRTEVFASVRAHWMPLDRAHASLHPHASRHADRFAIDSGGLANDPDVACSGDDLERDCIALLRRRVQLAPTLAARALGLVGARGVEVHLGDVMAFLARQVDDARVLALARPLMAITGWPPAGSSADTPRSDGIDATFAIVRLAHIPELRVRGEKLAIKLDPEPLARLAAGDLPGAIAICLRRLRASGLLPVVRVVVGNPSQARRLAASLAFPIRAADVARCVNLITKPSEMEYTDHAS